MENNIVHIEFYGLPGSGKTTISHALADKLRDNGYIVFEPTYDLAFKHTLIFRKLYQLFLCFWFIIKRYREFKFLARIINNIKSNFIVKINHLFNVAHKLLTYNKSKAGIYIWDEGILQSAISLTVNTNNNLKQIVNRFLDNNQIIISVYIKLDCKPALERMNKRVTNDSRVEKIKDEKLKILLIKEFENNCNKLSYDYCFYNIEYLDVVNNLYLNLYKKLNLLSGNLDL